MPKDSEEEIRRRAYDIWIREGSPAGRDREHWEWASRELRAVACQTPALAEMSMEELGQQSDAMLKMLKTSP
jgi:DNA-binding transcriptional LysR family regulator